MTVRKTSQGWVAPLSEELHFSITQEARKTPKLPIQHKPTGIYVHGTHAETYLNYAGLDDSSWSTFVLPSYSSVLYDLADAIRQYADGLKKYGR